MVQSRCGLKCDACDWRERTGCRGCTNVKELFWGACPVKNCCEGRGHAHCGQCDAFPCEQLKAFAWDKEHGDEGRRIETCRQWRIPGNG